ncbi:MFS transporter [Paraclostridium sordellii]|uniref:Transporter n=1 Tax=Paraclostridium sordellii TaxID=1505 RepID=A0A9P1L2W2_PARSO|nr:MFS transporter [Paeniclostridium sordellii]CEO33526.1 transporter [[Clostridium] sordellii] [Paeniclostridium sordellii]
MEFQEKTYSRVKWSIWWVLTISFVLVLFLRMSTAVISDNLSNELGFNSIEISNIASFTLYSYAFMQIPAGVIIDKFGARNISSLGMIIAGLGSILFGFIQNIELAYVSRVMVGAGTSVILLSMFKVQGNWFKKEEFAPASAKFSLIGNLGSVFATFPLVLLTEILGWRSSFILIGLIGILFGISIYFVVRNNPQECGFNLNKNKEKITNRNIKLGLKSVLTKKSTLYNSVIMFSLVGVTTAFSSLWGVSYIVDIYGLSKSVSAFIVSFLTYGLVFGAIVMNILFKKYKGNKFNIVRLGGLLNLFIWTFIVIVKDVKPSIVFLPVAFFLIGCINMTHLQAFSDVKYKNKEEYLGLSTSIINTAEFMGSGIINLFIGFMIQINGVGINGYKKGFMMFIVMTILTIIAATIAIKEDKYKYYDELPEVI